MRPESRAVQPLDPDLMAHPAAPAAPVAAARVVSSHFDISTYSFAYTIPEFAHGKVDPVEAGRKGGNTS
jgi:hypothetical protein